MSTEPYIFYKSDVNGLGMLTKDHIIMDDIQNYNKDIESVSVYFTEQQYIDVDITIWFNAHIEVDLDFVIALKEKFGFEKVRLIGGDDGEIGMYCRLKKDRYKIV